MSTWIPISEFKYEDNNKEYLVYDTRYGRSIARCYRFGNGRTQWEMSNSFREEDITLDGITHFMELPDNP